MYIILVGCEKNCTPVIEKYKSNYVSICCFPPFFIHTLRSFPVEKKHVNLDSNDGEYHFFDQIYTPASPRHRLTKSYTNAFLQYRSPIYKFLLFLYFLNRQQVSRN